MADEVSFDAITSELVAGIRATVERPVMYDLGSGQRCEDHFVGLDLFPASDGKRCDLYAFPWTVDGEPIPDESVDMLTASHFLEHVPDWEGHFAEVYRILKPGGVYRIVSPYYTSVRATMDPDHKQMISENRFLYLWQPWLRRNKTEHFRPRYNFSLLNETFFYAWHDDYAGKSDDAREFARQHYINVVDDIALILKKEPMPDATGE